ncbi:4973_t:CDS:2 [Acaulospora colombiana]|uniref:4973_t:CDS:1 n=1 Tax=Acaulospora colombiana TaxID=27376 RepID=A0ACA9NP21_9GLOM|nr:4973_t:CDS:2 [Acaulospora colombiana]
MIEVSEAAGSAALRKDKHVQLCHTRVTEVPTDRNPMRRLAGGGRASEPMKHPGERNWKISRLLHIIPNSFEICDHIQEITNSTSSLSSRPWSNEKKAQSHQGGTISDRQEILQGDTKQGDVQRFINAFRPQNQEEALLCR